MPAGTWQGCPAGILSVCPACIQSNRCKSSARPIAGSAQSKTRVLVARSNLKEVGGIQPTLPFTEYDFLQKYRDSFAVSELGRIHALLPLKEMEEELAWHFPKKHPQGNKPMLPREGEIALMFLKPYTGLSDDGLIELLNGSIHMQIFCGIIIDPSNPIKDGKIVSAIRNRLAPALDIVRQQSVLYKKWDSLLKDKDLCMSDATCYESHLRYPTDTKLMWECCEWLHALSHKICRNLGERLPRSKYSEVAKYCQMLLNGGTYGGRRVLSEATARLFTTEKSPTCRRGLGFDKLDKTNDDYSPTCCDSISSLIISPGCIGLLGFRLLAIISGETPSTLTSISFIYSDSTIQQQKNLSLTLQRE